LHHGFMGTSLPGRPFRRSPRRVLRSVLGAAAPVVVVLAGCVPAPAGTQLGSVIVDLSEQHAYLFWSDGTLAARVPVSTGAGDSTPVGEFRLYQKQPVGTASSDRSVHMDHFSVFVGGVGFHGIPWRGHRGNRLPTPLGERPVSHGCIRMADGYARFIYDSLPLGSSVVVRR
jgi:lipoprotein-anchoring transpeptidase ErfK/SrfK